jgi:hypothetical protein
MSTAQILKDSKEFIERSSSYCINWYGFNEQAITDLAKAGLDARMRLIQAIKYIETLAEDNEKLNAKVARLIELCDNNAIPRACITNAENGVTK